MGLSAPVKAIAHFGENSSRAVMEHNLEWFDQYFFR
jgi:hypothetical protein